MAGSIPLFWFTLLSKLTDSTWLLSASHFIAMLGFKLTLAIYFNPLAPYFLISTASADLH
jgi:NO-binding membrane sensor protein with MHYT domain